MTAPALPTTAHEKALAVNLAPRRYGTFAEIGAGQEVVRWFFRAGGAAGTIAKSISAYDMTVSDAIYGPCPRYVCRERLDAMLDYEYRLTLERLAPKRGVDTAFFSFADTVTARSFGGAGECHGWMGIQFQAAPGDEPSRVILHVRMLDPEAAQQQEALGIVGVNLVYGACFLHQDPERLLHSLLDALSPQRIEIDMIELSGARFRGVDNRVMSLRLVQLGLSGAAAFSADGSVVQPSELLHGRASLVLRGSFRPVMRVHVDMLRCALARFRRDLAGEEPIVLLEMTMRNLLADGELDLRDFLDRADALAAIGHTVLISNDSEYFRLAAFLARYTRKRIGLVMGGNLLADLFDERWYENLEGGALEAFGRLFRNGLRIYVYPFRDAAGRLTSAERVDLDGSFRLLHGYLLERGWITGLDGQDTSAARFHSREVFEAIRKGEEGWDEAVPEAVARRIRERGLFGWRRHRRPS
ncbi:MAG: TonB-dependent receptor [Deltaproteobacteria bacterium]|nr:TonB-dependent receptor [Deltaproteobacteria bacterium]